MNWRDIKLRIIALVFRNRVERDLDDELHFHVEMQTRKNLADGMGAEEAARRARIQFGGAVQVQEECRDARRTGLIDTTWRDVRYALRGFRRSPTFVLTVVATIALGLGLDTALFTIFNATYFRPIVGVRDPQALYEFYWMDRAGQFNDSSWPEYREFITSNPSFSEALAYKHTEARLDGRAILGTLVTGDYFRVLGVGAALGRTLLPTDSSAPGQQPVIVLSYRSWQARFLADPNIVGKKIFLRGYPFEVVGVAPAGFAGLGSRPAEFWAPLTMAARFDNGPDLFGTESPRSLSIVGRLKPEIGMRQAQAGLTVWMQRYTASSPDRAKAAQAFLISRSTSKPLRIGNALAFTPILVAFSLVLLMGCANVANMMLARSLARQREIGIRLSLGASRGRLIRQLLTESILLALPAAAAGIAVSAVAIRICVRVLVATLPPVAADFAIRIPELTPDLRVFGFTLLIALASAIVFGLAPALQATRLNVIQAARGDLSSDARPSRLRNALVVCQVTVCVVLLITAGALLRGADRMHRLDAGLSTRNNIDIAVQDKSREAVINRLLSEPSVETVAAGASAPVDRKRMIPASSGSGAALDLPANDVSPEYFTLFEIPIVRGRNFTGEEARSKAQVTIISQTAANRLWPNQDALGQSLRLGADQKVASVIGIARDEISRWIGGGEDTSLIYFPSNTHAPGNHMFVSARGDMEGVRRKIESDLAAIDPNAVQEIRKIQIREWVEDDAYYTLRVAYWLSSAIGVLALLLTLTGIYGVLSYVISQRT
ncbi:MAG TPA: ABC transporter permease, partial [Bryobacteraceae bacterium]|nr:ABC transporter permease [Bryobacteraceae bacterium]